ncbi:NADPH-dependent FMN reductase [Paracandidimonas soli]|uniref:NADPH-dependent FMN reductase n=2 Tax=Paracandidimonas soli TaxID=1917182 RepID=A0A4R3V6M9_9BURK|nr:NADPH-dependent FMN reductase [Paracandidimonas soli]
MVISTFPEDSTDTATDNQRGATLLIVWHSRTGAARQMAEAARQGAMDIFEELEVGPQTRCILSQAAETTPDQMLQASAYLFCCPENLASMSGAMKEFFDTCYYPVLDRIAGLPYALMVSAGTDGAGAVRQMQRICTGWRLREVAEPLLIRSGAQTPEAILAPKRVQETDLDACRTMGATLAALIA